MNEITLPIANQTVQSRLKSIIKNIWSSTPLSSLISINYGWQSSEINSKGRCFHNGRYLLVGVEIVNVLRSQPLLAKVQSSHTSMFLAGPIESIIWASIRQISRVRVFSEAIAIYGERFITRCLVDRDFGWEEGVCKKEESRYEIDDWLEQSYIVEKYRDLCLQGGNGCYFIYIMKIVKKIIWKAQGPPVRSRNQSRI